MAQRYAIDTARPFIQSAKDAPAFIFDHNGKLLGKTTDGIIQAEVKVNKRRTPYTILGNWVVALSVLVILTQLYAVLKFGKKRDTIKHK